MPIIGISGLSCAGKHTLANYLKKLSHGEIVNLEEITSTLYTPATACYQKIVSAFGEKIIAKNRQIDQRKLGDLVFSDSAKLKRLNDIVHPWLKKAIQKSIENHHEKTPLIIPSALFKELDLRVDYLVLVRATLENKLKRIEKRYIEKEKFLNILKHQKEIEDYDFLVENDGSLALLEKRAWEIWKEIKG